MFIFSQALVAAQLKMGADKESRTRAWEENELSSLAKAIVKFPAGSQNRELERALASLLRETVSVHAIRLALCSGSVHTKAHLRLRPRCASRVPVPSVSISLPPGVEYCCIALYPESAAQQMRRGTYP